jgi:hypothetical protein
MMQVEHILVANLIIAVNQPLGVRLTLQYWEEEDESDL